MNKYRSFSSAAPNFAFALALKKTSENLRDSYDLSCVKVRTKARLGRENALIPVPPERRPSDDA